MNQQLGGLNAGKAWRVWVTQHPIGAAMWAGVVGGQIATLWGIWLPGVGLPALDWPLTNGVTIDPKGSFVAQFAIGGLFHALDCLVFALVFALFVFPLIGKVVTPAMNMLKAVGFSMVLATISAAFLVPFVYYKGYHVGFGGVNYGGWKLVFAIYLWHLLYGVNLGAIYNPLALDDPLLRGSAAS
jgi:hypothetical protein